MYNYYLILMKMRKLKIIVNCPLSTVNCSSCLYRINRAGGLARAAVYAGFCVNYIDGVTLGNRVNRAVTHARAAGNAVIVNFVSHDFSPLIMFS
jgi:hypothetical protein